MTRRQSSLLCVDNRVGTRKGSAKRLAEDMKTIDYHFIGLAELRIYYSALLTFGLSHHLTNNQHNAIPDQPALE
jgi:hypothetical protein